MYGDHPSAGPGGTGHPQAQRAFRRTESKDRSGTYVLSGRPSILLADEPTGALDSATGREVLELFVELNGLGNTIVMITHDEKVARYAHRVVRIVDGELHS